MNYCVKGNLLNKRGGGGRGRGRAVPSSTNESEPGELINCLKGEGRSISTHWRPDSLTGRICKGTLHIDIYSSVVRVYIILYVSFHDINVDVYIGRLQPKVMQPYRIKHPCICCSTGK
jgi:hypothetical protein